MSQLGTMPRGEIIKDLRGLIANTQRGIAAGEIVNGPLGRHGDLVMFQRLVGELDRRGLLEALDIPRSASEYIEEFIAPYAQGLAAVEAVSLGRRWNMHSSLVRDMGQMVCRKLKAICLADNEEIV